jgi:RNA polymerase sigma-70 factor (ECF subfamily)
MTATFGALACSTRVIPMTGPAPEGACDADAEAVERVLSGDTEAFRSLVDRYQERVFRFVRNVAPRSTAHEDLAQDVFVSAFVALASFDVRRGSFLTWLFAIAKNKCINAGRKMAPLLVAQLPTVIDPTTPADELARAEIRACLDAALEGLPADQRECFVLAELVGLTAEQIAEIEGVVTSTIRSRLSRAKAGLRAALSQLQGEEP